MARDRQIQGFGELPIEAQGLPGQRPSRLPAGWKPEMAATRQSKWTLAVKTGKRSGAILDHMALRCLIVDDNAGFLRSARLLLEREGITVVAVASTGEDALRHAEALGPDVVLVDIDLGGESGFDVVGRLHGRSGVSASNVILISTHAEQDFADLIDATPAVGFISKSHLTAGSIHRLLARRGT